MISFNFTGLCSRYDFFAAIPMTTGMRPSMPASEGATPGLARHSPLRAVCPLGRLQANYNVLTWSARRDDMSTAFL